MFLVSNRKNSSEPAASTRSKFMKVASLGNHLSRSSDLADAVEISGDLVYKVSANCSARLFVHFGKFDLKFSKSKTFRSLKMNFFAVEN